MNQGKNEFSTIYSATFNCPFTAHWQQLCNQLLNRVILPYIFPSQKLYLHSISHALCNNVWYWSNYFLCSIIYACPVYRFPDIGIWVEKPGWRFSFTVYLWFHYYDLHFGNGCGAMVPKALQPQWFAFFKVKAIQWTTELVNNSMPVRVQRAFYTSYLHFIQPEYMEQQSRFLKTLLSSPIAWSTQSTQKRDVYATEPPRCTESTQKRDVYLSYQATPKATESPFFYATLLLVCWVTEKV